MSESKNDIRENLLRFNRNFFVKFLKFWKSSKNYVNRQKSTIASTIDVKSHDWRVRSVDVNFVNWQQIMTYDVSWRTSIDDKWRQMWLISLTTLSNQKNNTSNIFKSRYSHVKDLLERLSETFLKLIHWSLVDRNKKC